MTAPRLTGRGQGFLAAGVTIAVLGMLFGFPDVTRVGVLLTLLPVLTMLTGWRRSPRIHARRAVVPPVLSPGEQAEVQLELANAGRGRTPLYLGQEHLAPALGRPRRLVLERMDPGERHTVAYRVTGVVRGQHRVGPLTMRQMDPFGLTSAELELSETADVLVLPPVEQLGSVPVRGRGTGQAGHVSHMVSSHGDDDVSIRAYRDGDDLRRVHWPTTAHRGELMVRQEDRPTRRRAVLVLDPRGNGGGDTSFEWAVSALASVALHLAALDFAVHLVAAETVREGTAGRALPVGALLRRLAVARCGDGDLEGILRAAGSLTGDGGLVVAVLTDHDEPGLRQLAGLRGPGTTGIALLLDTCAFTGSEHPPEGLPGAAALAEVARAAGWRARGVRPGESVRTCWEQVADDELVRLS